MDSDRIQQSNLVVAVHIRRVKDINERKRVQKVIIQSFRWPHIGPLSHKWSRSPKNNVWVDSFNISVSCWWWSNAWQICWGHWVCKNYSINPYRKKYIPKQTAKEPSLSRARFASLQKSYLGIIMPAGPRRAGRAIIKMLGRNFKLHLPRALTA